jgi:predicted nucleic acid-binding protein
MAGPVFVASDVLLAARDKDQPLKRTRARAWLEMLSRHRLGRTSTLVLAEYYVRGTNNRRLALSAKEAWQDVQAHFTWDPLPLDAALMREARAAQQRHRLSWRDATLVAAARMQACVLLLTDELRDGATYGTLAVRSPFTLDVEEPRARYDVGGWATARPH